MGNIASCPGESEKSSCTKSFGERLLEAVIKSIVIVTFFIILIYAKRKFLTPGATIAQLSIFGLILILFMIIFRLIDYTIFNYTIMGLGIGLGSNIMGMSNIMEITKP